MSGVDTQKVAGGGRICFRGDSRPPSIIFKEGFHSREPDSKIRYNPPANAPMFIHPEHAEHYQAFGIERKIGNVLEPKHVPANTIDAYKLALQRSLTPKGQHLAVVQSAPDIDSPTAVCVTPRFSMAIVFPPKAKASDTDTPVDTWVYAVYVRELFNTHAHQVADGLRAVNNELRVRERIKYRSDKESYGGDELLETYIQDAALWPLYAQELATKSVEAKDVICALKVRRHWLGSDFTYGCEYLLYKNTIKFNWRIKFNFNLSSSVINAVRNFILAEEVAGKTPSRATGFHKDTDNQRVSINLDTVIEQMREKIGRNAVPLVAEPDVSEQEWLN